MFKLIITQYTFLIIVALLLVLLISIMIFISFIYHTKRKFDSIEKYNKLVVHKLNSYKENQDQINKNMKDIGASSEKTVKIIFKIIDYINKFRGSK